MTRRRPPPVPAPPSGLRAVRFTDGEDEFVTFTFPGSMRLPAGLSEAERAVVIGVLEGLSTLEIASARGVSARTVSNQLQRVYKKLHVGSRVELARLCAG